MTLLFAHLAGPASWTLARNGARALGAVAQHAVYIALVLADAAHLRGDRRKLGDRDIHQRIFEGREIRAAKFGQHIGLGAARKRGEDADKIVRLGTAFQPLLLGRQRLRIGFGLAHFLGDLIRVVGKINARIFRSVGFRHFLCAVAQAHDARRRAGDQWLRKREEGLAKTIALDRSAKIIIEFLGDVARQLQMLLLIVADRHMRRAIDQNVGGHQHRIVEQADRSVFAILAGLVLELRHAVQPADARHAVQHPGEFGVFRHLALVEDDVLLRIDAAGDEGGGDFAGVVAQLDRILRHSDRVQIDDAIDALMRVLQGDEFGDRAEIIPQMQIAGRLHTGEDTLFELGHGLESCRSSGRTYGNDGLVRQARSGIRG